MDCPLPVCNARTLHQHFGQPQYFNPHPGNEIRYPGYASSHRLTSSQSNEANKVPAVRGQEAPEAENFEEEEVAQEQDGHGQTPIASGDEKDDQEEAMERRTLIIAPEVAASAKKNDTQESDAIASSPKEQQDIEILHGTMLEQHIMMDDGIHDLDPGDPITSRRTLDLVEDLLTPLQTTPTAKAWNSRAVQEQPEDSLLTTSSVLQDAFDEVLAPMTPEQASELVEELQLKMMGPSGALHAAIPGETGEDDFEAKFGDFVHFG